MSPTIMIGAGMVLTAVMNLLRCGCYLAVILACINKPSPSQSACASCATSPAGGGKIRPWVSARRG